MLQQCVRSVRHNFTEFAATLRVNTRSDAFRAPSRPSIIGQLHPRTHVRLYVE